jgi:predicted flap endonuclease-1-like 5' DNA nuclease
MTTVIDQLRGMSQELATKLRRHGISNSDQLLEAVRTPVARKELAEALGIEPRAVLELGNRADLARIKGIGGVFSDLLEHAGVDTVKELATRRPDNLRAKMAEVNGDRELSGRVPSLGMVGGWVEQAKSLPRVLEY